MLEISVAREDLVGSKMDRMRNAVPNPAVGSRWQPCTIIRPSWWFLQIDTQKTCFLLFVYLIQINVIKVSHGYAHESSQRFVQKTAGHMSRRNVDLSERLDFMQFDERSRTVLRDLRPFLKDAIGEALTGFYDQVRATPETRKFFQDERLIDSAKRRQETHWDALASAEYSDSYAQAVKQVGKTHARIGLEPRWYIGGYALVTDKLLKLIVSDRQSNLFKRAAASPEALGETLGVLVKAVLLDMDLAISTYLEELEDRRREAETARAELARQQVEALQALTVSLGEISGGNLTTRIDRELSADFAGLKNDFNVTAGKLQDIIGAVIASMQTIESGNHELAQASDDLARRTEQQAASLEETTAALAQITEGVKLTTRGVEQARSVATTATRDAAHTSEIVSKSKAAMEEIKKATAQIGQITDVIDEIAFQTNLLA
ncbi:MAG: globin-coupled sensor protein, partial [Hyphomicrobiales bacterium]|nr:globin-coupled sensor protein [Hyphomicrobiales bacterium]